MDYGYICFAYSKNEWIAKIIARVTGSKWSHSFVTVPPVLGREMVLEAAANGVSLIPFDIAYRNNSSQSYEIYRFKADQTKLDTALSKAMNNLETSYGFLELPWFIWRSLNKKFGRDIRGQDNWSTHGAICSNEPREVISNTGFESFFVNFGKCSANAQDVYEIVLAHPELFELIESKE